MPPPRIHRHRYFGVLAANSPLRAAAPPSRWRRDCPAGTTAPSTRHRPAYRRAARYAWALLLSRIYEVLPLRCTHCGGEMRLIAFITAPVTVRDILAHLGEPAAPPRIAPARGPPLWAAASFILRRLSTDVAGFCASPSATSCRGTA